MPSSSSTLSPDRLLNTDFAGVATPRPASDAAVLSVAGAASPDLLDSSPSPLPEPLQLRHRPVRSPLRLLAPPACCVSCCYRTCPAAPLTPRAASKLVAGVIPLPRALAAPGFALLAAAPPRHRDPAPPGVSPRALAPMLWPATACCCFCGCAAPAPRDHHRATAHDSRACSPRPCWPRPHRPGDLPGPPPFPHAPGHTPARAAPNARTRVACSGSPRGTRTHYGP
nr:predicted GPI-anchored protein 58 [Aegilops tauschii subsp. strangulata]